MTIELIYTLKDRVQVIETYPFVLPILQDRDTLVEFACSPLSKIEVLTLQKISCLIKLEPTEKHPKLPDWFLACHGKLYFQDGVELS